VLFVDSTLVQANAADQGLRSRSLHRQLPRTHEFGGELWAVNEEAGPETEARLPEFRKPDSRRGGVNQIAVSPVDSEAQMFKKPGKTPLLSHKAHFVVDDGKANIITAVTVTGSCESDGRSP